MVSKRLLIVVLAFFYLTGCGFHLRGALAIPPSLQVLQISPYQPYEKFQQLLLQTLKTHGIKIVTSPLTPEEKVAILTLRNREFKERTIAYESTGQPNRALLQFTLTYELRNKQGKISLENGMVEVEREMVLNANAVLGTESERDRLKNDLYLEAALQLIRQLSLVRLS